MAEYIERDALRKILENWRNAHADVDDEQGCGLLEDVIWEVDAQPAADVAPVVYGRWIFTKRHLWYRDDNGNIDEWRLDQGIHNGPECQICHTAFCEHCEPDWSNTKCEIGHYYCSECMETSRDAHEDYCPHCGAKMDGGANNG